MRGAAVLAEPRGDVRRGGADWCRLEREPWCLLSSPRETWAVPHVGFPRESQLARSRMPAGSGSFGRACSASLRVFSAACRVSSCCSASTSSPALRTAIELRSRLPGLVVALPRIGSFARAGARDRVLRQQLSLGAEDERAHFDPVLPAFHHERYLRVEFDSLKWPQLEALTPGLCLQLSPIATSVPLGVATMARFRRCTGSAGPTPNEAKSRRSPPSGTRASCTAAGPGMKSADTHTRTQATT